ncbi:cytochrome c oxidase assembly protein COX19 [Colletotrichum higginsianum]|nr:cytochrome c oxidase assembly protein COX19 [Colletotrichum higginsianum]
MAKDEFRNLGFDNGPQPTTTNSNDYKQHRGASSKEKDARPGELRW